MNKAKRFDVRSKEDAQRAIAQLILEYGGDAATSRLRDVAVDQAQSSEEVAWRTAGNLLTSFTTRRPSDVTLWF